MHHRPFVAFIVSRMNYAISYPIASYIIAMLLPHQKIAARLLGCTAITLHGYLLYLLIDTPSGHNLSINNMLSLIAWLMAGLALLNDILRTLPNLGFFIYPIATVSIVLATIFPSETVLYETLTSAQLWHIGIAMAYY